MRAFLLFLLLLVLASVTYCYVVSNGFQSPPAAWEHPEWVRKMVGTKEESTLREPTTESTPASTPQSITESTPARTTSHREAPLEWNPSTTPTLEVAISPDGEAVTDHLLFDLWLPARMPGTTLQARINGRIADIPAIWKGGRRLWLPLKEMKPNPQGENDNILRLSFNGPAPEAAVVGYTTPRFVAQATGANLSDDQLLDRLDPNNPSLAEVIRLRNEGQTEAALQALAAHLRSRAVDLFPSPASSPNEAELAALLRGEMNLVGLSHTFPQKAIDWYFNPSQGTNHFTNEWGWSLHRHRWWETFAAGYAANGNDAIAQLWADQVRSWGEACPAPAISLEKGGSAWRGLEAGLRQSSQWPMAFAAMRASPQVSDATLIAYLKAIADHGDFLAGHPYGPGNHFLLAMAGLFTQGVLFPELADSAFWRERAAEQLLLSLERNTLPEGCWYELAPGYHQWVVNKCLDAIRLSDRAGNPSKPEVQLKDRVRKMAEWNVHLAAPDLTIPTVNDGAPPVKVDSLGRAADVYPESALLRWAAGCEDASTPPPPFTSIALPDSGYIVMRTGWAKTDTYVVFDTGPLGGWHGHMDALNLVAAFGGKVVIFDNGGYKYDKSEWRKFGPTTQAHNTILVDGQAQLRDFDNKTDPIGQNPKDTPPALFGSSDQVDYASGWYVGLYEKGRRLANHRREVALVKQPPGGGDPFVVVVDSLESRDGKPHSYQLRWHLDSARYTTDPSKTVVATSDVRPKNIFVASMDSGAPWKTDSGVKEPELLGWFYPNQNDPPRPALTLRRDQTGTGTVRFVTVLGTMQNAALPQVQFTPANGQGALSFGSGRTLVLRPAAPLNNNQTPSFEIPGINWPEVRQAAEPQVTSRETSSE
jgi:hypothetical protein